MKPTISIRTYLAIVCLFGTVFISCNNRPDEYSIDVKYIEPDSSRTITIYNSQEKITLGITGKGKPEYIGLYRKGDSGCFYGFDGDMKVITESHNFDGERHGKEWVLRDGFTIEEHNWINGKWESTKKYHYSFEGYSTYIENVFNSKVLILESNKDSIIYIDSTYFIDPEYDFTQHRE